MRDRYDNRKMSLDDDLKDIIWNYLPDDSADNVDWKTLLSELNEIIKDHMEYGVQEATK